MDSRTGRPAAAPAPMGNETPRQSMPSLQFCMDIGQLKSIMAEYIENDGAGAEETADAVEEAEGEGEDE